MLSVKSINSFPDGDASTRTTLKGKKTVVNWWKKWKLTSGVTLVTMAEFNHIPIEVISHPQGGFPMGIYDIVYFTTKMEFNDRTVGFRMNFSVHFDIDKKIDHYASYYDNDVFRRVPVNKSLP